MTSDEEIKLVAKMAIGYAARTKCTAQHAVEFASEILELTVKDQKSHR